MKTAPPLVSLIMPVRNRENIVERTLDSFLHQNYRPIEIIIVDNFSTDCSLDVCKRWANRHRTEDFSIILLEEKRIGAPYARNTGWKKSSGEWICFFDSDDEMSKEFIKMMVEKGQQNETAEWMLAYTRMILPDQREKIRAHSAHPTPASHLLGAYVSTQSFLVSRTLLEKVGGWNESLTCWQDYELGYRLLAAAPRPEWVNRSFHHIHRHAQSITGTHLHHNFSGIVGALQSIARHPATILPRNNRALFWKTAIVAGQLSRERHRELAQQLLQEIWPPGPSNLFERWVAAMLYRYVAAGGRGAWRWALSWL